jgi:hypothetical protein
MAWSVNKSTEWQEKWLMLMNVSHDLLPCQLSMPTVTIYCWYILVSRSKKKMHRRINKEIKLGCCMCSIISVVSITFNSLSVYPLFYRQVFLYLFFAYTCVSSNSVFRLWPIRLANHCMYRCNIFIDSILTLITLFQTLTKLATFLTQSSPLFHGLANWQNVTDS